MNMGKRIYVRMCDENDVAAMDNLCDTIHRLIQKQEQDSWENEWNLDFPLFAPPPYVNSGSKIPHTE